MELKGRIVQILAPQSGEGKNGTWKKQEYVIELPGQYPKKVCFYAWGDTIDNFAIKQDEEVEAIIQVKLSHFLDESIITTKSVTTSYKVNVSVPAYKLNDHIVWGATAMMLSELKDLLKQVL